MEVPDPRSGRKTVGQWAIHVQCDWNISKSDEPIISSENYYVSPDGQDLGNDWDQLGSSKFDAIADGLRTTLSSSSTKVISVMCGAAGSFVLQFDDGSALTVQPRENEPEEAWRLFQPGTEKRHFVVPPEPEY